MARKKKEEETLKEAHQEMLEQELEEDMDEDMREDGMEDDADLQEELSDISPGAVPIPEEQENAFTFLKKILDADDRLKTAYLTWQELGKPTFPVRYWISLANTCQQLYELDKVASYCLIKAHVTSDTSLSRDGFIINTSVTQKRVKERKSSSGLKELLASRSKG